MTGNATFFNARCRIRQPAAPSARRAGAPGLQGPVSRGRFALKHQPIWRMPDEFVVKTVPCVTQGARHSCGAGLDRDADGGAKAPRSCGRARIGLYFFRKVAGQQQDVVEALPHGFLDEHVEKRRASDRQERLGRARRQLAEASSKPPAENDRLTDHAKALCCVVAPSANIAFSTSPQIRCAATM